MVLLSAVVTTAPAGTSTVSPATMVWLLPGASCKKGVAGIVGGSVAPVFVVVTLDAAALWAWTLSAPPPPQAANAAPSTPLRTKGKIRIVIIIK
jgi:hypothetical protein